MTSNLVDAELDASQRPSAKFHVTSATMAPHKCISCSRSNNGREEFVDLACSYDYEGAQYLCMDCAKELARTIKFVGPEGIDVYERTYQSLVSDLEVADERIAALESDIVSLRTISDYIDRRGISVVPDSVSGENDSVSPEAKSGPAKSGTKQ